MTDMFFRFVHEHDQDEAEALAWWIDTADENKMLVLDMIQCTGDNPVPAGKLAKIVGRFAQLGMRHVAILAEHRAVDTPCLSGINDGLCAVHDCPQAEAEIRRLRAENDELRRHLKAALDLQEQQADALDRY